MQPSAQAHTHEESGVRRRWRLPAIIAAIVCLVLGVYAWLQLAPAYDVSNYTVVVEDAVYTGDAVKPVMKVYSGAKTLVEGGNFTATWDDNVEVGTGSVTITGKGTYYGTNTATFAIVPANMANTELQAEEATYTGTALRPTVQVKLGEKTLEQGVDYELECPEAVNAGTVEFTVTGEGNYEGTATGEFTIAPKPLDDAEVSKIESQQFTGEPIEPAVEVSCDGETLQAGTDFTVSYKKNTDAGTAKAVVKGTGNYAGKKSAKFTINPRSIRKAEVASIPGQASDDESDTPALKVTDGDRTLEQDVDYRVVSLPSESGRVDTVIVKGIGNYKDTQTIDVTVSSPGEALARAACIVSYSRGQYYGGGTNGAYPATELWKNVYSRVNPGSKWIRGCVTAVKVIVRWAGFDDSFPSPPNNPSTMYQNHLKARSDVWAVVGTWDGKISSLQPGDILTVQRNGVIGASGSDHSMIYVGHEIASEIYEKYLKGTDADLGAPTADMVFVSSHGAGNPQSNRSSAPCICDAKFALAYAYGKNAYAIIRPISGPNVENSKYANVMPDYRPF